MSLQSLCPKKDMGQGDKLASERFIRMSFHLKGLVDTDKTALDNTDLQRTWIQDCEADIQSGRKCIQTTTPLQPLYGRGQERPSILLRSEASLAAWVHAAEVTSTKNTIASKWIISFAAFLHPNVGHAWTKHPFSSRQADKFYIAG